MAERLKKKRVRSKQRKGAKWFKVDISAMDTTQRVTYLMLITLVAAIVFRFFFNG